MQIEAVPTVRSVLVIKYHPADQMKNGMVWVCSTYGRQEMCIQGFGGKPEVKRPYVEIICQLDAAEVFIADLIACSTCFGHHYAHHQELKSIIQWLLRVVFCAVVFSSSWSCVELSVMRPVYRTSVASSWHFISTY